jgi:adenylate cyclase
VELDPLSSWHRTGLCWWLVSEGQFDQAMEISLETLELDANNPWGIIGLARAYTGKEMYDKAISIMQGLRIFPFYAGYLGYLYGKAGNSEEAKKILDDFLDRSKQGYFSPYLIATVYSGLGEKDKAFEWLDKAYEVQDPWQWALKVDMVFHSLHSDPRWTEQMKKRGLVD